MEPRRTKTGGEALRWCGHSPRFGAMVFFTGFGCEAVCPGGDLFIKAPSGTKSVSVGQWVVKTQDGKLEVVDNDKIELAE